MLIWFSQLVSACNYLNFVGKRMLNLTLGLLKEDFKISLLNIYRSF